MLILLYLILHQQQLDKCLQVLKLKLRFYNHPLLLHHLKDLIQHIRLQQLTKLLHKALYHLENQILLRIKLL